ncbi:MAG: T9SS type A sorting domain-containing protein [Bacteroidetes bacterium]|nr:T9SS type A sorting domain-containing protein [Bacteroidota bacterium]
MKKLVSVFLGLLISTSIYSQTGTTCTTSLTLPYEDPSSEILLSQQQISQWYLFTSENTKVGIGLLNKINPTSDKVIKMTLWGGTCGTLTIVGSDTLSDPSDSVLRITAPSILSNTVYYLQINKISTTDIIEYKLGIDFLLAPPLCSNCNLAVLNSCDMICNGSFEAYSPTFPPQHSTTTLNYMSYACGWGNPSYDPSTLSSGSTPDYFTTLSPPPSTSFANSVHVPNNQFGTETTFQGTAYAGFFAKANSISTTDFWHEYIYQTLRCPLDSGVTYNVRFYVSLSDNSLLATNSIGAAFVDNFNITVNAGNAGLLLDNTGAAPQPPNIVNTTFISDTSTWTLITGTYTANGTEENIVIGNFGNTSITLGSGSSPSAYYYLDSVSVIPVDSIFSLVSDADSTICDGESVTIQSQVLDSLNVDYYYWTSIPIDTSLIGQDSMSIITVSPHDTTIYYSTIVVGSCDCTFHDTIQINVVPLPSKPLIDGDSLVCVASTSIPYTITNYDSTLTYSVTVIPVGAGGTASAVDSLGVFTVVYNDLLGDTLLITVMDSMGCDSFAVFIVKPCCVYGDTTFVNDSASHMIAYYGTSVISNQSFSINGTFTIDQNMTWSTDSVKLGMDAIIDILPGDTLYITNASLLSACDIMWDRIRVQFGSLLRVDKNSVIEDAKIAIYSVAGGRYILNGARLNRNLKHMELTPYTAASHTGTIRDTKFTCQPIIGSIATLNPPFAGDRTHTGIEINSVLSVQVGLIGSSNLNTFKNMNLGILATKSSVKVLNNDFKDMNLGTVPYSGIAAIKVIGYPLFPYFPRTLTVGDGTSAGLNTFKNCHNGILSEQNMNVVVDSNDFKQITQKCVFIKNSRRTNTVIIRENDFSSSLIGIHCLTNTICNTSIRDNKIHNMNNFSRGIWIQEISSSGVGAFYSVYHNTIKTVEYGIQAENLNKVNIDMNDIETEPYALPILRSVGIQVSGSYGARITSNKVKIVPLSYATKNGGIEANISPLSYIYCNTVKDMGFGIKCSGTMPSDVFNNIINNDFYGLWLANSGFIGKQDNPTIAGQPSYNRWSNIPVTGSSTTSKRTFTSLSSIGDTIIYRIGAFPSSLNALYNPNPTLAIGATPFTLTPTTSGTSFAPACPAFLSEKLLKRAQDIAVENISFPGNDLNSKWLSKHGLLVNIQNDSIDVSADPILQSFVNLSATENLGKLIELNATISDPDKYNTADMTSAQAISNSISPTNDIETNQKLINDIVINNYLDNITYTASQIGDLRVLANKCPFTDGVGVYQARVLLSEVDSLGTFYYNPCETGEEVRTMSFANNDMVSDENTSILIYPNPASNQLTINYKVEDTDEAVFEIYNLIGEKVMIQVLNASKNEQTISVSLLNSGVYFYKYSINGRNVKASKLVIVK